MTHTVRNGVHQSSPLPSPHPRGETSKASTTAHALPRSRSAAVAIALSVGVAGVIAAPAGAAASIGIGAGIASGPVIANPSHQSSAARVTCRTVIPRLTQEFSSQFTTANRQAIVVRGKGKWSSRNTVQYWQKRAGCWTRVKSVVGRNGYSGWDRETEDGSGLSPIGVFSLTDAGGRLPNPGTRLPYHYGPQSYRKFGYAMNSDPVQVFDYVIAVNFNRFLGTPPRDEQRPDPTIPNGGIWFHVNGQGPTRGCISVTRTNAAWTLRWLRPAKSPLIVMGNQQVLGGTASG